jgi:hypothetical protein
VIDAGMSIDGKASGGLAVPCHPVAGELTTPAGVAFVGELVSLPGFGGAKERNAGVSRCRSRKRRVRIFAIALKSSVS